MKTLRCVLSVLSTALLSATFANAQAPTSQFPPPAQGGLQALRHSSTIQEGILRGRADLARGAGEYNYNTAAAALIWEGAKSANLDNRVKYVETFWTKKQLYETYQAALRAQRVKSVMEIRQQHLPAAFRLPPQPVDPSQAGVVWPEALQRPEFDASRVQLSTLFGQRTPDNSGAASQNFAAVRDSLQQARSSLKQIVAELSPMQFVEAKQFLDRVALEGSQPVKFQVATK